MMSKRRSSRERKAKITTTNVFRSVVEKGKQKVEEVIELEKTNEKSLDDVKSLLKSIQHTIKNIFVSYRDNKWKLVMVSCYSRLGQLYYISFPELIYASDFEEGMIQVTRLNDNVVNRETEDFYINELPKHTSLTIIANSGFSIIGRDEIKDTYGYDDYDSVKTILQLEKFNISTGPCYSYEEVISPLSKSNSIYDIISIDSDTYTFGETVESCGLKDMLSYTGDYIVFVPTEETMEDFLDEIGDAISDNYKKSLVLNHIIMSTHIGKSDTDYLTLQGERITVSKKSGTLYVNDIKVIKKPIKSNNGTIYIINGIIEHKEKGYPQESSKYFHISNDYTINDIYFHFNKANYLLINREYDTLNGIFDIIRDSSLSIIENTDYLYASIDDELIPDSEDYSNIVSDGSENNSMRERIIKHNQIIKNTTDLAMRLISMKPSLSILSKTIQALEYKSETEINNYNDL